MPDIEYDCGTTGTTWRYWVVGTASNSATNSISVDGRTWGQWMRLETSSATTANTATAGETWVSWNGNRVLGSGGYLHAVPQLTAEQIAERDAQYAAQREQDRVQAEKHQAEQAEANRKANDLLAMFLTDEQREQLEKQSAFIVQTEQARYRIKPGWSHNVEELGPDDKPIASFCIHPYDYVPHGDNMLAQKIMLENDEAGFRRVANRNAIRQ